jgi:hypothetical protein
MAVLKQFRAYGTVLDIARITELTNSYANAQAQLQTAPAKFEVAKSAFERTKNLVQSEPGLSGQAQALTEARIRGILAVFPGVASSLKTFLTDRVEETVSGFTATVAVGLDAVEVLELVRTAYQGDVVAAPERPARSERDRERKRTRCRIIRRRREAEDRRRSRAAARRTRGVRRCGRGPGSVAARFSGQRIAGRHRHRSYAFDCHGALAQPDFGAKSTPCYAFLRFL